MVIKIDPLLQAGFSVYSKKGVYALLLGSGISRAARIPTGWEVVKDLITKLAALEEVEIEDKPVAWYRNKHGTEPNYSELLESLAKTPEARSLLLQSYFEPTTKERAEGIKVPTIAHKAIADLTARGYFRVILTTNFDRLMEQALEAEGVHPTVISTADAAEGALPLCHQKCLLLKLHGDYRDLRIKNTTEELEHYDSIIDELLDRILDEFGLVVCGWSAEWDTALKRAIERCKSHRFSTYWAKIGELGDAAKHLVKLRKAEPIDMVDADQFFSDISEKVKSMESIDASHPMTRPVAVSSLKRCIQDGRIIEAHDLIHEETEKLAASLNDQRYPGDFREDEPKKRLERYESDVDTLLSLIITSCYWYTPRLATTLNRSIGRVHAVHLRKGGNTELNKLRRYPALLLFAGGSMAAIASNNYDALKVLFHDTSVEDWAEYAMKSASIILSPNEVLGETPDSIIRNNLIIKGSEYLFDKLREPVKQFLSNDAEYEKYFDIFEYTLALDFHDMVSEESEEYRYLPIGRFFHLRSLSKHRWNVFDHVADEIEKHGSQLPLLQAGFFGGDIERLRQCKAEVDRVIKVYRKQSRI